MSRRRRERGMTRRQVRGILAGRACAAGCGHSFGPEEAAGEMTICHHCAGSLTDKEARLLAQVVEMAADDFGIQVGTDGYTQRPGPEAAR